MSVATRSADGSFSFSAALEPRIVDDERQGHFCRERGSLDAGRGPGPFEDLRHKLPGLNVRAVAEAWIECQEEQVPVPHAEVHASHRVQASQEEPGAQEQHRADRDLRDDQHAAQSEPVGEHIAGGIRFQARDEVQPGRS